MEANCYNEAKKAYAAFGIDTDKAIETLLNVPVSLHCWQGDDVKGFEGAGQLDGGIQATGNYPGAARTPEELMADYEKTMTLVPGKIRLNIHANYAIFNENNRADRDALKPEHFAPWVAFAKKYPDKIDGIDFNPTYFSHPMCKDGLTLSSPDEEVRQFWIRHGICCMRIAEYFARETGSKCLVNFWIPDGYKETPADRKSPRARFADSMDQVIAAGYDRELTAISIESKVFGIGLESYTVGSAEFCTNYAATRNLVPLMDNGHYHPTEMVSDKISSFLVFHPQIALHVTRPVRWDSDHVVRYDDETREIALEIVRCAPLDRYFLALDYFDASINRIAAWVTGVRSFRKALLYALLWPNEKGAALQKESNFTELFVMSEEIKVAPFAAVWEEYCKKCGVPAGMEWFKEVKDYEKNVLVKRV